MDIFLWTLIVFLVVIVIIYFWTNRKALQILGKGMDDIRVSEDVCDSSEDSDVIGFNEHVLDRVEHAENRISLLYQHLGLRYREVPTHGEVVTITPLSSLGTLQGSGIEQSVMKKSKERSA